jgi:hypothetical protein
MKNSQDYVFLENIFRIDIMKTMVPSYFVDNFAFLFLTMIVSLASLAPAYSFAGDDKPKPPNELEEEHNELEDHKFEIDDPSMGWKEGKGMEKIDYIQNTAQGYFLSDSYPIVSPDKTFISQSRMGTPRFIEAWKDYHVWGRSKHKPVNIAIVGPLLPNIEAESGTLRDWVFRQELKGTDTTKDTTTIDNFTTIRRENNKIDFYKKSGLWFLSMVSAHANNKRYIVGTAGLGYINNQNNTPYLKTTYYGAQGNDFTIPSIIRRRDEDNSTIFNFSKILERIWRYHPNNKHQLISVAIYPWIVDTSDTKTAWGRLRCPVVLEAQIKVNRTQDYLSIPLLTVAGNRVGPDQSKKEINRLIYCDHTVAIGGNNIFNKAEDLQYTKIDVAHGEDTKVLVYSSDTGVGLDYDHIKLEEDLFGYDEESSVGYKQLRSPSVAVANVTGALALALSLDFDDILKRDERTSRVTNIVQISKLKELFQETARYSIATHPSTIDLESIMGGPEILAQYTDLSTRLRPFVDMQDKEAVEKAETEGSRRRGYRLVPILNTEGIINYFVDVHSKDKDPEDEDPEYKDPEDKDPENKDPENKDPENKDPEDEDPEYKDPFDYDPDDFFGF